jgi:hypothetical protein
MGSPRLSRPAGRMARLAGLGVTAAIIAVALGFFILPLVVRAFVRVLELTLNGSLMLVASLGSSADGWTVATTLAKAGGRVLLTTPSILVLAVLVLVGAVALYALQRLLGTEEESS